MGDMIGGMIDTAKEKTRQVAEALESRKSKRAPKYPATGDERKVLAAVEDAKRVRQYTIEMFEPIWTRCVLYAAGIQHLRYIRSSRTYERRKVEDWKPQPTINIIQPKVQRVIDFFTRNRPTAYVDASSKSEEDQNAAKLGDSVLDSIVKAQHLEMHLDEIATWMVVTGNGFAKTYLDKTARQAARVMQFEETDEPVLDAMGMPILSQLTGMPITVKKYVEARDPMTGEVQYDEIPQPDVSVDVFGPINMTVPLPSTRGTAKCPWMMETGIYPVDYLRETYPDKAEYISLEGSVLTSDLYTHRITNIIGSGMAGSIRSLDPQVMKGFAVVNTYERAPDPEFPNGLLVVESEGTPLLIGDLPLGRRLSYTHFGYYRVPGRFWCRGMVEDLVPIQDQINKLEQMLQVNDGFNTNPMWLVPKGAGIAEGRLKNKPGNVVEYDYPYEPRRIPGESMPAQIIQRQQLQMEYAEEVSGVRHVLTGDAPPGVTAGVALNRLGEESEGIFAPIEKRYSRSVEELFESILEAVQRYYTYPRYMAIEGDDGGLDEIRDFVGTQLKGNTKVRIEAGSYRPRSKAAQQQILFDALNMGILPGVLTDPGHHREFLDRIGVDGFDTTMTLDHKRAKWENEMLSRTTGWEQVKRESGDNDMIHMEVHTQARKTAQWRRLPFTVQERHLMHEVEHLDMLMMSGGRPITTGGEDAMATSEAAANDIGGGDEGEDQDIGPGGDNEEAPTNGT